MKNFKTRIDKLCLPRVALAGVAALLGLVMAGSAPSWARPSTRGLGSQAPCRLPLGPDL